MELASPRIHVSVLQDLEAQTALFPFVRHHARMGATAQCQIRAHAKRAGQATIALLLFALKNAIMVVNVSHQMYASASSGEAYGVTSAKLVDSRCIEMKMEILSTLVGLVLIVALPSVSTQKTLR